jgi:hypothetical protein
MDIDRRRALIEQYRDGVAAVDRALEGISEDDEAEFARRSTPTTP